jgi:hypothetical protein
MLVELDPQWRVLLSTRELVLITKGLRQQLTSADTEEAILLARKLNKGRVGSTKTILKQADILMENLQQDFQDDQVA